jgi:hypothetical protein
MPICVLPTYLGMFYQWKTEKYRKTVGYILGFLWAIAFGAFCGYTGFLRD